MCLLLAVRDSSSSRLWVGANRDERLTRPWRHPALVSMDPPVLAGLDLEGGGSWLAVNLAGGFVVGVTNARLGAPPGERSRGQLVLDAAVQQSLPAAVALLTELDTSRYGPFNLLLVAEQEAFVATNFPTPQVRRVEEAVMVLGNEALGREEERTQAARQALAPRLAAAADDLTPVLMELLASHQGLDPFCRHVGPFGTVSSTVCVLAGGRLVKYLFAPGPPCRTPYGSVRWSTEDHS